MSFVARDRRTGKAFFFVRRSGVLKGTDFDLDQLPIYEKEVDLDSIEPELVRLKYLLNFFRRRF